MIVQSSFPDQSLWSKSAFQFTVPYYLLSFSLTFLTTALVTIRLLMHKSQMTGVLGKLFEVSLRRTLLHLYTPLSRSRPRKAIHQYCCDDHWIFDVIHTLPPLHCHPLSHRQPTPICFWGSDIPSNGKQPGLIQHVRGLTATQRR